MSKITILCGPSGSGKSTWAKEEFDKAPDTTLIVNRDKIRELLFGHTEKSIIGYYTQDKNAMRSKEKQVTRFEDSMIYGGLEAGKHVIVDATHLEEKYLARFEYWNVPTDIKFFDVDMETCVDRCLMRARYVSRDIIKTQHTKFKRMINQKFSRSEQAMEDKTIFLFGPKEFENDPKKPPCYIFDIDGTLAHKGDRSPYDWKKVGEDSLDDEVGHIAGVMYDNRYKGGEELLDAEVFICTGRDKACVKETEGWLKKHDVDWDELFMRPKGDMRADWVVKEEMWRYIAKTHYIAGMFDDRLQVVRRARALGLKVFNVAHNDF